MTLNMIAAAIPALATAITAAAVLWCAHWLLLGRRPELGADKKFSRQLTMLVLTVLSIVVVVLALPVSESTRNQLIGLVGLVISGIFAFSSTTIFANLLAGIMLRVTRPFHTGDFIRIDAHAGRIAETGLLDTEIQTETRELISIPNTLIISHPVSVVRSSGTIISATLSIGYDVHHKTVEACLLKAASESGLEEPFVHLMELGNFSITYRISGLLKDVKSLLTARSTLHCCVLDALHAADIEIMSPSFMNQRRLADDARMIPPADVPDQITQQTTAEDIIFDKAEAAARIAAEKETLNKKIQDLKAAVKTAPEEDRPALDTAINDAVAALADLENAIDTGRMENGGDGRKAADDVSRG